MTVNLASKSGAIHVKPYSFKLYLSHVTILVTCTMRFQFYYFNTIDNNIIIYHYLIF